ncbi:MAG: chemotaxis protein CheB [Planctomycetota bacterium]|nr:chemotaxis protein CheB [Planctomycetota bacterium]
MSQPPATGVMSSLFEARLVVIGASLGGVAAVGDILAGLPADFPVAVAVVQHRSERARSFLAEVLQRRTGLTVEDAQDGDAIRPGCVHLAPAGFHLIVGSRGVCELSHGTKVHFSRPSADVLFKSAAGVYPHGVIGVILTGGDSDGTSGLTAIKESGGVTIAQSPSDSEDPSMPTSAIRTGDVDLVLDHLAIAEALIAVVRRTEAGTKPIPREALEPRPASTDRPAHRASRDNTP